MNRTYAIGWNLPFIVSAGRHPLVFQIYGEAVKHVAGIQAEPVASGREIALIESIVVDGSKGGKPMTPEIPTLPMHGVVQIVFVRLKIIGRPETHVSIDQPGIFGVQFHAGVHPVVPCFRESPGLGGVVYVITEVPIGVFPGDTKDWQLCQGLVGKVHIQLGNLTDLEFGNEAESAQLPGTDAKVGAQIQRFIRVQVNA